MIGEVSEGIDVISKLNEVVTDEKNRPYQDIRITHTIVLHDPFPDFDDLEYPQSPEVTANVLESDYLAVHESVEDAGDKDLAQIEEEIAVKEAHARATILEMVGDLPDADAAPPENVLFVCKLNPVTTSEDLEIIFSRFGKVNCVEVIKDRNTGNSLQYAFVEFDDKKFCESAYFKMDNVLIDDRRIHVDFSQSVSQFRWKGRGKGAVEMDNKGNEINKGFKPAKPVNQSRPGKLKGRFIDTESYDKRYKDKTNVDNDQKYHRNEDKHKEFSSDNRMKHSHNERPSYSVDKRKDESRPRRDQRDEIRDERNRNDQRNPSGGGPRNGNEIRDAHSRDDQRNRNDTERHSKRSRSPDRRPRKNMYDEDQHYRERRQYSSQQHERSEFDERTNRYLKDSSTKNNSSRNYSRSRSPEDRRNKKNHSRSRSPEDRRNKKNHSRSRSPEDRRNKKNRSRSRSPEDRRNDGHPRDRNIPKEKYETQFSQKSHKLDSSDKYSSIDRNSQKQLEEKSKAKSIPDASREISRNHDSNKELHKKTKSKKKKRKRDVSSDSSSSDESSDSDEKSRKKKKKNKRDSSSDSSSDESSDEKTKRKKKKTKRDLSSDNSSDESSDSDKKSRKKSKQKKEKNKRKHKVKKNKKTK